MKPNPDFAMPEQLEYPLPYASRLLSPRELKKLDVYSYLSPKEGRLVRVVGLSLIVALRLEFSPDVSRYVERPRRLNCNGQVHELSFWYRERNGRERCVMVVPHTSSSVDATGRRQHRHAQLLLEAAERASVPLRFEAEAQLLEEKPQSQARLRMLPMVQTALRLNNRLPLRQRILEFSGRLERFRLSQLVKALEGYAPADVRAVACDLIHIGRLQLDVTAPLSDGSLMWRTAP